MSTDQEPRLPKRRILSIGPVKPVRVQATVVHELSGADTVFKFPSNVSGPIAFARRGGPILSAPSIKPIFWGGEWGRPSPPISPTVILDAIARIISGPYLNSLGQYGITGKPAVQGPMYVLDSEPPPGNPTLQQITSATRHLLEGLIDDDELPEPDENWSQFNVVFLASTVPPQPVPGGVTSGAHSSFYWKDYDLFDLDHDLVRFAFIGTRALGVISALDMTTSTFSHELVEAMTDPDLRRDPGWLQTPDPGGEGGEIADVCGSIGRLDGIAVRSYWSNAHNACVIPTRDHSTHIAAPVFDEVSKANGSDLYIYVDRICGKSDRWRGSYTYHVIYHKQTITMTATTKGYSDPTGSWTVAGVEVKAGDSLTITPTLNVSSPKLLAWPDDGPRAVTLSVVATETTLQLSNHPADGNFLVPVIYTASERSDDLDAKISTSYSSRDVSFEGQTIWTPPDFKAEEAKCIQAETAAIERHMKDLQILIAEFKELLKTHKGPPINQELRRNLRQASLDLARRLSMP